MYRKSLKDYYQSAIREVIYRTQQITNKPLDRELEDSLRKKIAVYFSSSYVPKTPKKILFTEIKIDNTERFLLYRGERYQRFSTSKSGSSTDSFGRKGDWIDRGVRLFYDKKKKEYIKLFDEYFCKHGEGYFLEEAFNKGFYDFLCPHLQNILVDVNGHIRGYSIREGRSLTKYEFDFYISGLLEDVICHKTKETGLYLNDLIFHNVIVGDNCISIIDLESILPVEWFGKNNDFAYQQLDKIDVGLAVQKKFQSPKWYSQYIKNLQLDSYLQIR